MAFLFEPGDGPPAYPALIEAADEIFVTADSVAMVADAVTTGKPVGLVPIAKSRLGKLVMAIMDRLRPAQRLYPRDLRFFWDVARKTRVWRDPAWPEGEQSARLRENRRRARQAAFGAACTGHSVRDTDP